MSFHLPVLGERVVASLLPTPSGPIVDGTLGGGGHSAMLLSALSSKHRVVGIDRDPEALSFSTARISDERFVALRGTFGEMKQVLERAGEETEQALSGILVDLGVSSFQLDTPRRGFAFKHPDAPLDMRMDPTVGTSARERIEEADVQTLSLIHI